MKILTHMALLATCLLFSGCFFYTSSARKDIRRSAMVAHEFTGDFHSDDAQPLPGRFVGRSIDGDARYQWTNALVGDGRVLEIRLPEHSSFRAEMFEVIELADEMSPAFLLPENMGRDRTPQQYFADHYPDRDPWDFIEHTLYVSPYMSRRISSRNFDPRLLDVFLLTSNRREHTLAWVEYQADADITWRKRSRLRHCLSHMEYLYSVPLDVVTFPIQLIVDRTF